MGDQHHCDVFGYFNCSWIFDWEHDDSIDHSRVTHLSGIHVLEVLVVVCGVTVGFTRKWYPRVDSLEAKEPSFTTKGCNVCWLFRKVLSLTKV